MTAEKKTNSTNLRKPSFCRLTGEEGLIAATIAQAWGDLRGPIKQHRYSAAIYFQSTIYEDDLRFLGLPSDWLPQGVQPGHLTHLAQGERNVRN